MHRIALFNLNETRRDPRVRRIAATLVGQGHAVRVFELGQPGMAEEETLPGGVVVTRVPAPTAYGRPEMRALEVELPDFAALIRRCDRAMLTADWPGPRAQRLADIGGRLRARLRRIAPALAPERPARPPLAALMGPMRSVMLVNLLLFRAALGFCPTMAWSNDLDTLPAGDMLKRRLDIPLVYDAHEIYPEQLPEHLRSDRWHRFYTALEAELAPRTDGRLTVCDAIGEHFARRYGAPGFVTVLNVPSIRLQPPRAAVLAPRAAPRRLIYHGAYMAYRGLEEIIRAAHLVDRAHFVFRGIGAHEAVLRRLVEEEGVQDRIAFVPPVAVDELVGAASDCDIGLNPFVDVCLNTSVALPNKFFEYMMAGLALASSDLVEMRRLTRSLEVGVLFPSLAPEAIAGTLNDLLRRPAELDACRDRAWTAAQERFNWEMEREKLLALLARLG